MLIATFLSGVCAPHVRADDYGATARARAAPELGATSVESTEATRRPGAFGEPGRALLDAPGAARTSFLGSELALWGAAPSESRTYVDGVEIPMLYHAAGLRTTVHPALIERVAVTPGAPAAPYGRSLGGAVDVQTVTLREGYDANLRVDGIDASTSVQGGTSTVRALVGARHGYFDRVLQRLAPSSQALLAVPAHQDGVARLTLRLDADTDLSITWIGAREHVTLTTDTGASRRSAHFQVGSLALERRYADAAHVRVTPFVGFSARSERSAFFETPLALESSEVVYGLRAEYARPLYPLTVRLGLDVRGGRAHVSRHGTLGLPAREGDVRAFGQAPIDEVDREDHGVTSLNVGPWLALTYRFRALTVTPSFRLETFLVSVDRLLPAASGVPALGHDALFVFPEPRLTVRYRATADLTLEGRAGLHHQPPAPTDLGATFGTPTLGPARASQNALGLRLALPRALIFEASAFAKSLRGLAVRTEEAPPPLARQLASNGRGAVYGASLSLLRAATERFFCAASYTLSRSVRSGVGGRMRRFDHDQTHVASALVGFSHRGFVASVRGRAATGAPRTPVVGSYFDAKSGRAQPLFGPHNGLRLPTYFALDLHAEYTHDSAALQFTVFVDVLNATNRMNVEEVAYTADFARRRDVTSVPVVGMAGFSVRARSDDE